MAADVTIILNPASGRGAGARARAELKDLLRTNLLRSWELIETTGPGDATRRAKLLAEENADIVVAAGGDGTLFEVLNGLAGSKCKLGVIPIGTGNDFARSLGLGKSLQEAVATLTDHLLVDVDLGKDGDHWFINVAGCGFDAKVAQRINEGYRMLRGTSAYVAAVFGTLARYQPQEMRVEVDGRVIQGKFMLCAVANAMSYGGGMKIAPSACFHDGLFDVVLVRQMSKLEFIRQFPKVFKGNHIGHPSVVHLRGKSVTIETKQPQPVLIDGEMCGFTPKRFEMHPAHIGVLQPIHSEVE